MEHGFASGRSPPPPHALKLGHQPDSGEYYCAVATTQWGGIPGKARGGKCWYTYWGKEHESNDFRYITHPNTMTTAPSNGCSPPIGARPIGYQNDGRGPQYAVIANTRWGTVPGKACENTCWYGMNGQEYETRDFKYLTCSRVSNSRHEKMDVDFVRQSHPPENGLMMGYQNDGGGNQWIVVADTPYGKIPGKAKGDVCWYTYDGKEHETRSFHYVIYTSPHRLVRNTNSGPPYGAVPVSQQTDGRGEQYSVIACTQWGSIPGKAGRDNKCFFGYNGQEHETSSFEWVVFGTN